MFNLWTGEKWNMPKSYNTITSNEDICGQENYEKQLQVFSIVHFSCLIFVFKWLKMQLLVIQKKKELQGFILTPSPYERNNIQHPAC